jgi:hypothetical protein
VLPLSEEIAPNLPAMEVIANRLGVAGVLDTSKLVASSLFYLPSAEPGKLGHHGGRFTLLVDRVELLPGVRSPRSGHRVAARAHYWVCFLLRCVQTG